MEASGPALAPALYRPQIHTTAFLRYRAARRAMRGISAQADDPFQGRDRRVLGARSSFQRPVPPDRGGDRLCALSRRTRPAVPEGLRGLWEQLQPEPAVAAYDVRG